MTTKISRAALEAALSAPGAIRKALADEQRFAFGVAYPAKRLDGHDEFMSAKSVEAAAWSFVTKGMEVGFHHADGTLGHGQVVESAIHRGPAYIAKAADGTEHTVGTGDWVLGVVFDRETWPLIKSGRVNGWSIQGFGKRRSVPRTEVESTP